MAGENTKNEQEEMLTKDPPVEEDDDYKDSLGDEEKVEETTEESYDDKEISGKKKKKHTKDKFEKLSIPPKRVVKGVLAECDRFLSPQIKENLLNILREDYGFSDRKLTKLQRKEKKPVGLKQSAKLARLKFQHYEWLQNFVEHVHYTTAIFSQVCQDVKRTPEVIYFGEILLMAINGNLTVPQKSKMKHLQVKTWRECAEKIASLLISIASEAEKIDTEKAELDEEAELWEKYIQEKKDEEKERKIKEEEDAEKKTGTVKEGKNGTVKDVDEKDQDEPLKTEDKVEKTDEGEDKKHTDEDKGEKDDKDDKDDEGDEDIKDVNVKKEHKDDDEDDGPGVTKQQGKEDSEKYNEEFSKEDKVEEKEDRTESKQGKEKEEVEKLKENKSDEKELKENDEVEILEDKTEEIDITLMKEDDIEEKVVESESKGLENEDEKRVVKKDMKLVEDIKPEKEDVPFEERAVEEAKKLISSYLFGEEDIKKEIEDTNTSKKDVQAQSPDKKIAGSIEKPIIDKIPPAILQKEFDDKVIPYDKDTILIDKELLPGRGEPVYLVKDKDNVYFVQELISHKGLDTLPSITVHEILNYMMYLIENDPSSTPTRQSLAKNLISELGEIVNTDSETRNITVEGLISTITEGVAASREQHMKHKHWNEKDIEKTPLVSKDTPLQDASQLFNITLNALSLAEEWGDWISETAREAKKRDIHKIKNRQMKNNWEGEKVKEALDFISRKRLLKENVL